MPTPQRRRHCRGARARPVLQAADRRGLGHGRNSERDGAPGGGCLAVPGVRCPACERAAEEENGCDGDADAGHV